MTARSCRVLVATLALLGAGIASYLLYVRYAHVAIACTSGGCEKVQSSRYAKLAGIPVAGLGLFGYLAILATTFRDSPSARIGGMWLAAIGVSFSLYLLVIQVAVVDAICQWCVASDIVMLLVFFATLLRLRAPRAPRLATAG
ncbi:MAG: vitamin K epoxide reductase family protein [Gaiellaceae bacterium]